MDIEFAADYVACDREIDNYLKAQEAKGLIHDCGTTSHPTKPPYWLAYKTHWGMHCDVILPEIKRMAARHGLSDGVKVNWKRENDAWDKLTRTPGVLEKDACVFVELLLV